MLDTTLLSPLVTPRGTGVGRTTTPRARPRAPLEKDGCVADTAKTRCRTGRVVKRRVRMSRVKPASGSLKPTSPVSTTAAPRAENFLDGGREAALLAEVEEYRRRFEDLLTERAVEMREAAARVRRESDDRRRAEADARASEQLFRILVEPAPTSSWSSTPRPG